MLLRALPRSREMAMCQPGLATQFGHGSSTHAVRTCLEQRCRDLETRSTESDIALLRIVATPDLVAIRFPNRECWHPWSRISRL